MERVAKKWIITKPEEEAEEDAEAEALEEKEEEEEVEENIVGLGDRTQNPMNWE